MSNITSSSYPVVTDSQSGDLFTIVRNGQVMKMNRAALQAYIESLAPNTFLALTDAPGTFVGMAGKVPAVNIDEDALEFVDGEANYFVSLLDGPGNFATNALKIPRVNAGETALEYFTQTLLALADTPATFAGASEYLARVNTAANAIEFASLATVIPTNATAGSFDYEHAGANQAYTGGSGFVKVLNDGAGTNTRTDLPPSGVTSIYDPVTSQFDFSELSVGDNVTIRIDWEITTTAANQSVTTELYVDNNGAPFVIVFDYSEFKTAAATPYSREITFFVGSDDVKNNPIEVQFSSDANATLNLGGWAVFITRRGA